MYVLRVGRDHPRRAKAETMIAGIYERQYQAVVPSYADILFVAFDDNDVPVCAAGVSGAPDGFFSENYLDQPAERALAGARIKTGRDGIMEITTLAGNNLRAFYLLLAHIARDSLSRQLQWCLFTATGRLRTLLRRTGIPVVEVADASAEKLPDVGSWGRYYDLSPKVCAASCQQVLDAVGRRTADNHCDNMGELFAAFRDRARNSPDNIAFSDPRSALSWSQLAHRVARSAEKFAGLPKVIGLLGESSIDWVVADLALTLAGRVVVPLPPFFSPDQLRHIIADAEIGGIVASPALSGLAESLGQPVHQIAAPDTKSAAKSDASGEALCAIADQVAIGGERIIYTSGSTGQPKGVRLSGQQICTIVSALISAAGITGEDRHLSVLPFALLLEQIAGIYVSLLAGGRVHIAPDIMAAASRDSGQDSGTLLAKAVADVRPTVAVLVPQLLQSWVDALNNNPVEEGGGDLRFVAVGGAPVPSALARRARNFGIPVFEGYGLSECASVVALNRPGAARDGTVGRPLDGLTVTIEDGEIIVHGPSVMDGYLGNENISARWPTGDLGFFDDDGFLTVTGRKDNLIVLPNGRNVSPEWVESMILADPGVAFCVVVDGGAGGLLALVAPSGDSENFDLDRIRQLCAAAPAYAKPSAVRLLGAGDLDGMMTANGRPKRDIITAQFGGRLVDGRLATGSPD